MVRVNSIPPENFPRICAITLGEIEAGNLITPTTNQIIRDAFMDYVFNWFLPRTIYVKDSTRQSYAEIIGKILTKYPMTRKRQKTERHLVENVGIDINDVWIASVALQHNLILVTHDGMEKIKEVIEPDLEFDDWLN